METRVRYYKGNQKLAVIGIQFHPTILHVDEWDTNKGGEEIVATPAEISYVLRNAYSMLKPGEFGEDLPPIFSAHGIGDSSKDSSFDGKLIIAPIKYLSAKKSSIHVPDYDRAALLDPKLLEQRTGFIQRWEILGEYQLTDGTTQYLSMPISGSRNLGLGVMRDNFWSTFRWRKREENMYITNEFLPLMFLPYEDGLHQFYNKWAGLHVPFLVITQRNEIKEREESLENILSKGIKT